MLAIDSSSIGTLFFFFGLVAISHVYISAIKTTQLSILSLGSFQPTRNVKF